MLANPVTRWILVVVALYLGCTLLVRLLAGQALYHPEVASGRAPAGVERVRDRDGQEVAVLHLPRPGARFTLWLFHGNAEDLGDLEPGLRRFHEAGFAVYAHDYPGYGVTPGRPTEASLYASARRARRHLRERLGVPAAQTILYGRSLGGGPAVQLATEEAVGGLVLQSTFTSVYRVVTQRRVFPFDLFENERKLAGVACPVLVMHGREDEVIPFGHGLALHAAARDPRQALWVPGATHNDLVEVAGESYWAALREFSRACEDAAVSRRKGG